MHQRHLPQRAMPCSPPLRPSAIISLLSPEARFLNEDHLNISFVSPKNEPGPDGRALPSPPLPSLSRARSTYDGGCGGIKVARPSPLLQKRHRPELFVQGTERTKRRQGDQKYSHSLVTTALFILELFLLSQILFWTETKEKKQFGELSFLFNSAAHLVVCFWGRWAWWTEQKQEFIVTKHKTTFDKYG